MKLNMHLKLFFAFVSFLLSTPSFGQWTLLPLVNSQRVTGIVTMNNTVFVSTLGSGIYKSDDDGATWTDISPANDIRCIFKDGSTLYAGAENNGLFSTTDNGQTWHNYNLNLYWVLSGSANGNTILIGTTTGMYKSPDAGATWQSINTGLPNFCENSASLILGSSFLCGSGGCGVYRSSNGSTWNSANVGFTNPGYVDQFKKSGTSIYVAKETEGAYVSNNNGNSWSMITSGLSNTSIYSIETYDTMIFCGTWNGVIRSSGNGVTWTDINFNILNGYSIYALGMKGTTLFAATHDGRIWKLAPATDINEISNNQMITMSIACSGLRTEFTLNVNKAGNIRLLVKDITGKTISQLHNDRLTVGQFKFEQKFESGGVYIVELISSGSVNARKFIALE